MFCVSVTQPPYSTQYPFFLLTTLINGLPSSKFVKFFSKIAKLLSAYIVPSPLTCGVIATFSKSQSSLSAGKGSGSVTSSAAPRNPPSLSGFLRAAISSSCWMTAPLAILTTNAFFLPKISNSSSPRKCRVSGVNGTATSKISISCFRKLCREALSSPLNHSLGMRPSSSPVPGTIYPWSLLLSGVLRGEAV